MKIPSSKLKYLNQEYGNPQKPLKNVMNGKYVIPYSYLRHPPEVIKKEFEVAFQGSVDAINKISQFLSPDNNALVKSFQSTEGKGLAGCITSLSFDWYDGQNIQWEITPGKKAPKMCNITLSFDPIHDISPGLDANGYNRAPIYPVGFHSHRVDNIK